MAKKGALKTKPLYLTLALQSLLLWSGLSVGPSAMASPTTPDDGKPGERESIEVITVTGEKLARSLKDTASSVAVINQQMIESGQLNSVSDALHDVANVVVLTGSVPDIRGVSGNGAATGFNTFTGGARARVSQQLDGISQPFVAEVTGDTGLWDIAQMEVFRGPQSTSHGRNSIGGAVVLRSKDPSMQQEGELRVGYRNQAQYLDSALAWSTPLVEDELAVRVATQWINGETFSKPVSYDTNPSTNKFNELDTKQGRVKLLWTPKAHDELRLLYTVQHYQEQGNAGRLFFDGAKPRDYIPLFQRQMTTESDTHSLTLNYELAPQLALETLVGYLRSDWLSVGYEADPADESDILMAQTEWTFDSKLTIGDAKQGHSGFVGVAYFGRTQDFNSQGMVNYFGDDRSSAKAIYGEANYVLASNWNLVSGARIEREAQRRDFNMLRRQWNQAQLDNSKAFALPKLVLQYQPTKHTTLSLGARQGYNAGGGALNMMTNEYYYYDAEKVNTYELSARSVLAGGDVNLSANLFWNDFQDYQALNSVRAITNITKAHSYGLEVESYAMVAEQWQLHAGLGLLRSAIDAAAPAFASAIGNALNSAPELTGSMGVKYWWSDAWQFDVSQHYVGEFYGDLANSPSRMAGDYSLTRLAMVFQQPQWQLSLFANNVFDSTGYTVRDPASPMYANGYVAMISPRTLGASIQYSF
jgi:outer membrane receptor protein involved in Fe transport